MHATVTTLVAALAFTLSPLTSSTPRITGVAPQVVVAGPSPQQVTVVGAGFMPGLSLAVMNPAGSTQVYKNIDVQSQEEASFRVSVPFPTTGAYLFTVTNTDGGVSQPFRFDVGGPKPVNATAPVIDSVTPQRAAKQSQPQALTIDGKRFVQGLTVTINDPAGNATTVSGTQITNLTQNSFVISVVLTVEGEYTVSVTNPDGLTSNSVSLSVRHLMVTSERVVLPLNSGD